MQNTKKVVVNETESARVSDNNGPPGRKISKLSTVFKVPVTPSPAPAPSTSSSSPARFEPPPTYLEKGKGKGKNRVIPVNNTSPTQKKIWDTQEEIVSLENFLQNNLVIIGLNVYYFCPDQPYRNSEAYIKLPYFPYFLIARLPNCERVGRGDVIFFFLGIVFTGAARVC